MSRLTQQFRVVAAVLILSLGALGFGALPTAASSYVTGYDVVVTERTAHVHEGCQQEPCTDHGSDHGCPSVVCCPGGCSAILAMQPSAIESRLKDAWNTDSARSLSGLGPLVNKHPPRDRA